MAGILAVAESKFSEFLRSQDKESKLEKTIAPAETYAGIPRERMVSMSVAMLAIYVLLGNYLPLFSHVICIYFPVKESFKILRKQEKPTDNVLLYWIVYSIVTLFDFSFLTGFPFYYFAKIGLFLSFTTNGMSKLREWTEPAMKFTENWVLVPLPAAHEAQE